MRLVCACNYCRFWGQDQQQGHHCRLEIEFCRLVHRLNFLTKWSCHFSSFSVATLTVQRRLSVTIMILKSMCSSPIFFCIRRLCRVLAQMYISGFKTVYAFSYSGSIVSIPGCSSRVRERTFTDLLHGRGKSPQSAERRLGRRTHYLNHRQFSYAWLKKIV